MEPIPEDTPIDWSKVDLKYNQLNDFSNLILSKLSRFINCLCYCNDTQLIDGFSYYNTNQKISITHSYDMDNIHAWCILNSLIKPLNFTIFYDFLQLIVTNNTIYQEASRVFEDLITNYNLLSDIIRENFILSRIK